MDLLEAFLAVGLESPLLPHFQSARVWRVLYAADFPSYLHRRSDRYFEVEPESVLESLVMEQVSRREGTSLYGESSVRVLVPSIRWGQR